MKKNIHPAYYPDAKIYCACGNVIEAGSTIKEMRVEICSACHPLYTGKKKLIDSGGRVDRFKKMVEKAKEKKNSKNSKTVKSKKAKKTAKK